MPHTRDAIRISETIPDETLFPSKEALERLLSEHKKYRHGALVNHPDFVSVRERIIELYDSLTTQ